MKQFISQIQTKLFGVISVLVLIVTSIVAWAISYRNELIFAYNDAMSHLNIARLVIDNQEPGLAQLGSVWLPVNHVLPIIFVWNDWAWRTGLAASVFSMGAYVASAIAIYKTIMLLTKNKLAGVIGTLAFATNLNILYLQATPLTEPIYVCLFALSVYVFTKWLFDHNNGKYLLLLGALGFLQVLTRYDGWFVVAIEGLLILVNELFAGKENRKNILGKLFLYGLPVGFGMVLWFLWNAVIFTDPLFFALGEYSSHGQSSVIAENAGLLSKGDIWHATRAYIYTMIHNIGEWILGFALLGIFSFFVFLKKSLSFGKKLVFLALLVSPILFNIISMFFGFSTVQIPELYGDPITNPQAQWFNVRFGIVALPFAAILIGMFANWKRLAAVLGFAVIVLQGMLLWNEGIITLIDGQRGVSAFRHGGASNVLHMLVKEDDTVLMSMAYFNPVAYKSNIQLNQIIHEGVSKEWGDSLTEPQLHVDYIVMGENVNKADPVRQALFDTGALQDNYTRVYIDKEVSIYRRTPEENMTYSTESSEL